MHQKGYGRGDPLYPQRFLNLFHQLRAKLQIHSPAGLTIYAIVNKLVEINDIKDTIAEE